MDIPLDVGASGRSSLQNNWTFLNFPIAYADLSAGYTTGLPGVTVDCRASGQPQYSNNIDISASMDTAITQTNNDALAAPGAPIIFLATKGEGVTLDNFIRISPADIDEGGIGLFVQKIFTGEDCANPNAYRYFLCSQLLTE